MDCVTLLIRWDRGFESYSRHGYLCAFILCLCCSVNVEALRWADLPSKGSYHLCEKDYESEEDARAQQGAVEPLMKE
jgi:hypothetical protein